MFGYNLKMYCFIQELLIGDCVKMSIITSPRDQLKTASLPDSLKIFRHLRKSKFFILNNCVLSLSHYKVRALR